MSEKTFYKLYACDKILEDSGAARDIISICDNKFYLL